MREGAQSTIDRRPSMQGLKWILPAFAALVMLLLSLAPFLTHTDDDFCFLRDIRSHHDWASYVSYWWNTRSGRWGGSLLRYFYLDFTGFRAAPALVAVLLLSAVGACLAVSRGLYGAGSTWLSYALVATTGFLLLVSHPEEMFFWSAAGFDYTVGYLFTGLMVGCCAAAGGPARWRWVYVAIGAACAFVACGFVEVQALAPPVIAAGCLWFGRKRRLEYGLIFCGALAGAAVNLLAPGPHVRRAGLELDIDYLEWLSDTLLYGARLLVPVVLLMWMVSAHPGIRDYVRYLGNSAIARIGRAGVAALATGVLVYPFIVSAAVSWSLGAAPPGRTRNMAVLALILCWPVIYVTLERLAPRLFPPFKRAGTALAGVGLALVLSVNLPGYLTDRFAGVAKQAYQVAREQERILNDTPSGGDAQLPVVSRRPHTLHINDVKPDAGHWVNVCMAGAWGVGSVRAR